MQAGKIAAFFWTLFAGAFNDNFYKNALIIWIAFSNRSLDDNLRGTLIILCSAVFILPFFLFSATAGRFADRYSKTTLIRWTKAAEIIIMGTGAIGFALASIPLLIVVLFLMGAQSAWFGPAKYGIVPELVEEEDLLRANGLVTLGTFTAILLGTLFGGMAGTLPTTSALRGYVIVLAALFGWLASLWIPKLRPKAPSLRREGGIWRETLVRLHEVRHLPSSFPLLIAISWFWFHGAFVLQLLPLQALVVTGNPLVPQSLAWLTTTNATGGSLITLSLVLFSGGIGLGSLISGRQKTRHIETASSVTALILLAASALLLPLAEGIRWLHLGLLTLAGMAAGLYSIPLYSVLQAITPADKRARVFAGGNILDAGFMVAASLLMQGLEYLSLRPGLRFIVLGLLDLFFLFVWLYPKSDLIKRYRLRFLQDSSRELIGRPEGACLVCYPASFSRARVASLALAFPSLPAGYDGSDCSPAEMVRLLAVGTSVIQKEGRPLPVEIPFYQVSLVGNVFICTRETCAGQTIPF